MSIASLIIPTYNRQKIVLQTLDYLNNQVGKHFEIIVVDQTNLPEKQLTDFTPKDNSVNYKYINIEEIGYVNAHGTSTQVGDMIELSAVEKLFESNKNLYMSSNKSAIGHLLGAAGAVEAIFSLKSLETKTLPPTLNLDNPSTNTSINLIPHESVSEKVNNIISNSFGFGGTNASLIFGH